MGDISKTNYGGLRLKSNTVKPPRALSGHPWVFGGEVEGLLPRHLAGQGVPMRDGDGRWLGMGIYNPKSQIVWRRYSYDRLGFDEMFIENAIAKALKKREGQAVVRLVWSEADGLPGLVVDRFHAVLVVQSLTLAIDQRLSFIIDRLRYHIPGVKTIWVRNDAPSRQYEGLPLETYVDKGESLAPNWYVIDGIDYWLDFEKGQKTGFYLDQRQQHQNIAKWTAGKRVLDGFCNQGGFALQAAKAGAESVLAIDSSSACIALTQKNALKNGYTHIQTLEANMFDWLSQSHEALWDVIVLDPPSFARNKEALAGALRGYKELNLRALKLLKPGGILASYVCSHAVSRDHFHQLLAQAAFDARRVVQIVEETGQPLDHPVLVGFPESAYLKGVILKVD